MLQLRLWRRVARAHPCQQQSGQGPEALTAAAPQKADKRADGAPDRVSTRRGAPQVRNELAPAGMPWIARQTNQLCTRDGAHWGDLRQLFDLPAGRSCRENNHAPNLRVRRSHFCLPRCLRARRECIICWRVPHCRRNRGRVLLFVLLLGERRRALPPRRACCPPPPRAAYPAAHAPLPQVRPRERAEEAQGARRACG